jgi:cell wall-associated NlpC family hydrolase
MRRCFPILAVGVLTVSLGVASARADGTGTTTTTTTATTTEATTTAAAPSYGPLSVSTLPAGCVGAGAAAIVPPSHAVVALGTPASNLGPSGYPSSASLVAFGSSTVSGSACPSEVSLASVSLFGGAVTATNVAATDGRGSVSGLEIDGTPVSLTVGQTVGVEGWGRLTLGTTVGRLRALLAIYLLEAHDGLLAGTTVAVAFAAAPQPVVTPKAEHHSSSSSRSTHTTSASSQRQGNQDSTKTQSGDRSRASAPDFPATANPFLAGGELASVARRNPIVSIASRYLGVAYLWGGASPKTGFDCSGLVKYVFAQLGVTLPHFAAAQYYSPYAVWVSPSRLKPGDLVFFTGSDGTRKAPGHVGIYVGDGYLIDAPHTGAFVQVDRLDERWFAEKYVGAKRIVSRYVHTRHLLHTTKPAALQAVFHPRFPSPIAIEPVSNSLGAAAAGPAAIPAWTRSYWIWVGSLAGGLLVLALLAARMLDRGAMRAAELFSRR